MQLAQLEAFIAIANARSVSAAAQALYVTQPALSARLAALERELGTALFVRTGRGMELTPAGRSLVPYAQRALAAVADGAELVADLRQGRRGRLAVGAAPAVSTYILPLMLTAFTRAHPEVRVAVRTGHSEEVLAMVAEREVDVGLVRELRHPDVVSRPLYEDELVLVVHPEHALAARGRVPLEALGAEQLILFDRTSSYHALTSALFRGAGVTPRGAMEVDNIEAAKKMVQHQLGVAFLPATAVADELAAGLLHSVALADASPVRRRIVAIFRRDADASAGPAAEFLGSLRQIASEISPERLPRRVWLAS